MEHYASKHGLGQAIAVDVTEGERWCGQRRLVAHLTFWRRQHRDCLSKWVLTVPGPHEARTTRRAFVAEEGEGIFAASAPSTADEEVKVGIGINVD